MELKNNLPLVSVIIPAYNHEKYIQEAVESIINQTYENIELIVIDDGSKDSTWQKLCSLKEKCEKRFSKVIFEKQENKGAPSTLNKLISFASGKYVYIIASDDVAKSIAIEKEVSFLEDNPEYVLVVGDNEFIDGNSNVIGWDEKSLPVNIDNATYKTFGSFLKCQNKDIDFNSDLFGRYKTFVKRNYIPNGYLIRMESFHRTGGYIKEAPLEDWYMNLQLSKIGKMKYIDEILFSYRWHNANTVKNKEYMSEVMYKTLLFERKLVASMQDKKWHEIFEKEITRTKMVFNFCNIVKFYKRKDIDKKQCILQIFKCNIVLYCAKITEL